MKVSERVTIKIFISPVKSKSDRRELSFFDDTLLNEFTQKDNAHY